MQNFHQSTWHHEIWYAERSSGDEEVFNEPTLAKNQKYKHGGRLHFNINLLFV
jgi:hypothetical protein